LELDHIVPLWNGGRNVRDNAQTLCRTCHQWKTSHIDVPAFHAAHKAAKGATVNPL